MVGMMAYLPLISAIVRALPLSLGQYYFATLLRVGDGVGVSD